MSSENSSEKGSELKAEDHSGFSQETFEMIQKSQREYRQRKRRIRRWELNPIFWFLDEFPSQEMYRPFSDDRRNTRQEKAYHRLRQVTSWTYWSHMKSTTGLKFAAAGGLVSAFFQAAPGLSAGRESSDPLGWLLISGLLYVLAVLWFEFQCPSLLKRVLNKDMSYLGIEGRRWLLALVDDELRRWWAVKLYWPDVRTLDLDSNADETVLAIMSGYGVPAFPGFDEHACAHIERALYEYSLITKTTIWRHGEFRSEHRKFEPQYSYGGGRQPVMSRLHLSRLSDHDAMDMEGAREGDLMVRWFESSVHIHHRLPQSKHVDMAREAEGVVHLFESDESAMAFTKIIASWQNTMRPGSRLVLMLLFLASAGAFCWFVYLQMRFMVPHLI